MKYTYATLLLHETDAEINEQNLTNVLEAARADEITTSRIKALVAALEDVDIAEYAAAATPTDVEAPEVEGEPAPDERDEEGAGLVFGEEDSSESDEDVESETGEDIENEQKTTDDDQGQ